MPQEIKTLDARIREKAAYELKQEIHRAFDQVSKYFRTGSRLDIEVNGKDIQVWQLFEILEKKAFDIQSTDTEEKAVRDFLANVENFQEQLNDLRSSQES